MDGQISRRAKKHIAHEGLKRLRSKPGWDPKNLVSQSLDERLADTLRQERFDGVFLSATDCPECLKERARTNDPSALCQEHLAEALTVGQG